jgi:hypothetical protein
MDEDTVEGFLFKLSSRLEDKWGIDLHDLDGCYDDIHEFALTAFEPFYTKERNYN